jgi:TPR repeat protein
MLNLCNTYRHDLRNKSKAREWLKKAESLQDTYSIRKVADYYFQEDIIKTHINKAISLYHRAIKMGDTQAYKELGDLYFELDEYVTARKIYQEGAEEGNIDCMVNFGMILSCAPDCFEPAKYWLMKAVNRGDTFALKVLGDLYEGYGEYAAALRWYRKAAYAGEKEAVEYLPKIKKYLKKHKPDYKLQLRDIID